jgi:hypothetical protein
LNAESSDQDTIAPYLDALISKLLELLQVGWLPALRFTNLLCCGVHWVLWCVGVCSVPVWLAVTCSVSSWLLCCVGWTAVLYQYWPSGAACLSHVFTSHA